MKVVRCIYPTTVVALLISFMSCQSDASRNKSQAEAAKPQDSKAIEIISKVVEVHGGDRYRDIKMSFKFRKHHYRAAREGGQYTYERFGVDSLGRETHDILSNSGLKRLVNGEEVQLSEKQRFAYTESVNSVVYFVLLPYFLLDPAVNSTYVGAVDIKGEPYDKVKITFDQEGGGVDFEDEYLYWFHRVNSTLDYLAYNYKTDGGGARFRAAYNPRVVGGIRFADYANYKPDPETRYINNFDTLFQNGGLKQVSLIETEEIVVH